MLKFLNCDKMKVRSDIMKRFYTTTYHLQKDIVSKPFRILLLSDLHFSYKVSDNKLHRIIEEVNRVKPTYIFIVGDLIDSVDMIKDVYEKKRLLVFLKKLSSLAIVLISLGNHDCYKKNKFKTQYGLLKKEWLYFYDESFVKSMNKLPNVHVLINEIYEDDCIYVLGVCNSFSYYHINGKKVECKKQMEADLEHINSAYFTSLPTNKVKFLMVHSPVHMKDSDILETVKGYDYILSGHMHYGCVPPIINELWNSNRGIISPAGKLFFKNVRNTFRSTEDKLIVNGALTTFQECTGIFQKGNVLFPIFDSVLDFKQGKEFVLVEKKYHK